MNLINLLCLTFLLSHVTLSPSKTEASTEADDTKEISHATTSLSETEVTTEADTKVISDATTSLSETEATTEADTKVTSHATTSPSETEATTEAGPKMGARGSFKDDDETPKGKGPLPSSPDNGHEAHLEADVGGKEKNMTNSAGNEAGLSRGKAAGILVSSGIIAMALIWISKMIYTRFQAKTYDLRQNIEMGNP